MVPLKVSKPCLNLFDCKQPSWRIIELGKCNDHNSNEGVARELVVNENYVYIRLYGRSYNVGAYVIYHFILLMDFI